MSYAQIDLGQCQTTQTLKGYLDREDVIYENLKLQKEDPILFS